MRKAFYYITALGMFVLLCALAVFTVIQSNRLSNVSLRLENSLTASLNEAVNGLRTVENDLSKLMITADEQTAVRLLSAINVKSSDCAQEISKLPVVATSMQNTLKFANQVSGYCTSVLNGFSDGDGFPDNFDEQIKSFFATCGQVNEELGRLEGELSVSREALLTQGTDPSGSGVFGSIDNTSVEYPSVIFDGPFSDGQARTTPKRSRDSVSGAYAKEYTDSLGLYVTLTGEMGGVVPSYKLENDNTTVHVAKAGGLLLSIIKVRNVESVHITESEAQESAEKFAKRAGYVGAEVVWCEFYGNTVVFNFAPKVDGVIIYPDIFKIKIALDNGEVLGFEGKSYIMNEHDRKIGDAGVSVDEAREKLKEGFLVKTSRKCIISVNEKEHLTYEFFGEYNGLEYAVYISAVDGNEKTSFRILNTETGMMVA